MRRFLLALVLSLVAISAGSEASAATKRPKTHTVYPNQTLSGIAKRYNITVKALCGANGIHQKDPIKPNQKLVVPALDDPDGSLAARAAKEPEAVAKKSATPAEPKTTEKAPKQADRAKKTVQDNKRTDKRAPSRVERATKDTKPSATAQKKAGRNARGEGKKPSSGKGSALSPAKSTSSKPKSFARAPKRTGFIVLTSLTGTWSGKPIDARGRVSKSAQTGVAKVLASWRSGHQDDIHDRLIRLMVRVSDKFGGRPIRVVSGYRPYQKSQHTPHSKHNDGRAMDFFIPGVPNEAVRDFIRTLPNVGVGYYPNSSFVHLDVREVSTYWIDYSGPGEAPRYANAKGQDPGRQKPAAVGAAQEENAPATPSAQESAPSVTPTVTPTPDEAAPTGSAKVTQDSGDGANKG